LSFGQAEAPYLPTSPKSRATLFSMILGAHVLALALVASVGGVAVVVQAAKPMLVDLLPEPPRPMRHAQVPPVPVPQMRKPEVVIPEPPRVEVIQAAQVVERPALPPPPSPAPVVAAAAPEAPPPIEPPRFGMAYLNNPAPAYPVFAKRAREQGTVMLRVRVDAAGKVEGIELHQSSGSDRLDKAALAAVRQWRFVPARQGERAVAGVAIVPINFQLES
jgi:protein TonB